LVLRLNQETRASSLHVLGVDRTRRHPTSRPSGHRVPARPVRPSPVLCIRSPTPTTVLVAARHAAPATCTPQDKETRFSERNKDKRKTKQNKTKHPAFKFKPRQVNDSSQSNQGTDHLVSQQQTLTQNICPSHLC
jgi:hypothetical protein